MKPPLLLFALVTLSLSGTGWTDLWEGANGKKISADFVSLKGEIVKLRKADGNVIEVPLSTFSESAAAQLKAAGEAIPPSGDGGFELSPNFPINGPSAANIPGNKLAATIERPLFDVEIRQPEVDVKLFLKQAGKRIGAPFSFQHFAATEGGEVYFEAVNGKHVQDEDRLYVYRVKLEGGSTVDVICLVALDRVKFGLKVAENKGLTENVLNVRAPVVGIEANDKVRFYSLAHLNPSPWESVEPYLKSTMTRITLPDATTKDYSFVSESIDFPEKVAKIGFGGPAFGNLTVVMETNAGSVLLPGSEEETAPVGNDLVRAVWKEGFAFRFALSSLEADPRKETLTVRVADSP